MQLRMRGKLNLLFLSVILTLVVTLSIIATVYLTASGNKELDTIHANELNSAKATLKNYVDMAYTTIESRYNASKQPEYIQQTYGEKLVSVIDAVHAQADSLLVLVDQGKLTETGAQNRLREIVRQMRFDEGAGYLWIHENSRPFAYMIEHPIKPALNGKKLDMPVFNCARDRGENLFNAMNEVIQADGKGYVDYIWPKPGKENPVEKISYVQHIPKWNWVIGTGIYVDDARENVIKGIKTAVGEMRYDEGTGYFWINDTTTPFSRMVMHPIAPQLNGKELKEDKYNCALGEGKNLFSAMRDVVLSDNVGFVDYVWPKPGEEKPAPKLSYVRLFEPLGWVIGTGIYTDEIEQHVNAKVELRKREIRSLISMIILSALILSIVSVTLFYNRITKILITPLNSATKAANNIAQGILENDFKSDTSDEIGDLSRAFSDMSSQLAVKTDLAETIASGDLTTQFTPASDKDVLGRALQNMSQNILNIISQIRGASLAITESSRHVRHAGQGLSDGTTQQAAAIEEITSTTHEINTQASQNADNAGEVRSHYDKVQSNLKMGSEQMEQMMSAMNDIDHRSQEISKIIKSIDDIAFQTNLLALNAAVEAARAGQYGKGFAVVADEVRNLAQRSAQSARETADLITGALQAVEQGKELSDRNAEAFSAIQKAVDETGTLISEIAKASADQATAVEQINSGLDQINDVTLTNNSTVDESINAARDLMDWADQLSQLLEQFTIESDSATAEISLEDKSRLL